MESSRGIDMPMATSRPPQAFSSFNRPLPSSTESFSVAESCPSSWNSSYQAFDAWRPPPFNEPSFMNPNSIGQAPSGWNPSDHPRKLSSDVESTTRPTGSIPYSPWMPTGPSIGNQRQIPGPHSSAGNSLGLTGSAYLSEPEQTNFIGVQKSSSQRAGSNRDEFDGPHQLLDRPTTQTFEPSEEDLISLPTHLEVQEQDYILNQVNACLSRVAFNFVAMYQFPIPLEPNKRRVRSPADREWNEWVFLLKRLATKRRIPARVLYNGEIRQLNTVLENSLEMRHVAMHRSRPIKDDRNILQLISAGTQVAKILKDASAMRMLDTLYVETEMLINSRR